jgi:hypothetical protein
MSWGNSADVPSNFSIQFLFRDNPGWENLLKVQATDYTHVELLSEDSAVITIRPLQGEPYDRVILSFGW